MKEGSDPRANVQQYMGISISPCDTLLRLEKQDKGGSFDSLGSDAIP